MTCQKGDSEDEKKSGRFDMQSKRDNQTSVQTK